MKIKKEEENEDSRTPEKMPATLTDESSFAQPPLTIIVGAELPDGPKSFYAHEKILAESSELFAAALRDGWSEGEERVVKLPKDLPSSFEIFLHFIYHRQIRVQAPKSQESNDTTESDVLCGCWAFGEKLGSTAFQDAVMDALISRVSKLSATPHSCMSVPYKSASTPNSLSRLVVDIVVYYWNTAGLEKFQADPSEYGAFWRDVAIREHDKNKGREIRPPFQTNDCTYHEHVKKGLPCYKTLYLG